MHWRHTVLLGTPTSPCRSLAARRCRSLQPLKGLHEGMRPIRHAAPHPSFTDRCVHGQHAVTVEEESPPLGCREPEPGLGRPCPPCGGSCSAATPEGHTSPGCWVPEAPTQQGCQRLHGVAKGSSPRRAVPSALTDAGTTQCAGCELWQVIPGVQGGRLGCMQPRCGSFACWETALVSDQISPFNHVQRAGRPTTFNKGLSDGRRPGVLGGQAGVAAQERRCRLLERHWEHLVAGLAPAHMRRLLDEDHFEGTSQAVPRGSSELV